MMPPADRPPARTPKARPPSPAPGQTFPCPGCGRPVAVGSVICTQCGQQIGRPEQFETRVGRPEPGLPPIPPVAPGPSRFRDPKPDPFGRREALKPFIALPVSLLIILLWKGLEDGAGEAGAYLIRYGITAVGAILIVAMGAMMFIEVGASAGLAIVAIAAAVAGGDLVQHILHYTLMPALAWVAAIFTCLAMLADFLDIDVPDAVFLTFGIYLLKWILKMTLFASMFAG